MEQSLSAADAALALEPLRFIRYLSAAWHCKVLFDCDGDPVGPGLALEDAGKVFEKLPALARSLVDLTSTSLQNLVVP